MTDEDARAALFNEIRQSESARDRLRELEERYERYSEIIEAARSGSLVFEGGTTIRLSASMDREPIQSCDQIAMPLGTTLH